MAHGVELLVDGTLDDAIRRWEQAYDFEPAAGRITSFAGGLS
ncbi:hypothetical protein PO002_37090 [Cupriavidus necator]